MLLGEKYFTFFIWVTEMKNYFWQSKVQKSGNYIGIEQSNVENTFNNENLFKLRCYKIGPKKTKIEFQNRLIRILFEKEKKGAKKSFLWI